MPTQAIIVSNLRTRHATVWIPPEMSNQLTYGKMKKLLDKPPILHLYAGASFCPNRGMTMRFALLGDRPDVDTRAIAAGITKAGIRCGKPGFEK